MEDTDYWVTPQEAAALQIAITYAETVFGNESSTPAEINNAKTVLETALELFNSQKKPGKKASPKVFTGLTLSYKNKLEALAHTNVYWDDDKSLAHVAAGYFYPKTIFSAQPQDPPIGSALLENALRGGSSGITVTAEYDSDTQKDYYTFVKTDSNISNITAVLPAGSISIEDHPSIHVSEDFTVYYTYSGAWRYYAE
ncbi:hypothetical protein [Breznakiella homolactica]|uniref:Uncharacterized protein n=1 Tax=Breznakiella homolactica TaxID=2798577 RepID=A0A7T8B938_9SPIR|nr:hypothetical protein [Breznakiella homolactica]QQO09229.1 hypothetical protein JFL75_20235 [Breznakiella homolactica]